MTDVAVLVPVLNRPSRVAPLVESFLEHTEPRSARLVFVAQTDDDAEIEALAGVVTLDGRVDLMLTLPERSTYPQKINDAFKWDANRGYDTADVLVCAADDVEFTPGWLDALLAAMRPGVGVIGTRDGGVNPRVAAGTHSVHSAVLRDYIDTRGGSDIPGQVLHEGYRHSFCDDELIGTARARRAFVMSDAELTHLHPYAKTARMDSTYRLGMSSIAADRQLWSRRRRRILAERRRAVAS